MNYQEVVDETIAMAEATATEGRDAVLSDSMREFLATDESAFDVNDTDLPWGEGEDEDQDLPWNDEWDEE